MHPIRTLADLIHAVTNSLSLISSHSQYMLGKRSPDSQDSEELQIIYEEAERAANLLTLVPRAVARSAIHDAEALEPPAAELPRGTGGSGDGKGCQ